MSGVDVGNAVLSQFVALKTSDELSDRLKAVQRFSAESLGEENWLIGLMGMLYDPGNRDPNLLSKIVEELLPFLTTIDSVFVVAILKGFLQRRATLEAMALSAIRDALKEADFVEWSEALDASARKTVTELSAELLN